MSVKTSNSKRKAVFSEINITPLTDIFLVLLIIMMVVAPTFQQNNAEINIPEINSGLTVEEKNATVSITKDGQYFLNGNPIDIENLAAALSELKPKLAKAQVLVKADASAKSRDIMEVMRAAKEAEYEKLTVAGEPLTKKEQKVLSQNANYAADADEVAEGSEEVQINVVPVSDKESVTEQGRPYAESPANNKKSGFSDTDWEE